MSKERAQKARSLDEDRVGTDFEMPRTLTRVDLVAMKDYEREGEAGVAKSTALSEHRYPAAVGSREKQVCGKHQDLWRIVHFARH
jgi:hypothetical protein